MEVTPLIAKKFNNLYNEGYGIKAIEEITGFGHSTINKYIESPRLRGTVGGKTINVKKIKGKYPNGISKVELINNFIDAQQSVSYLLKLAEANDIKIIDSMNLAAKSNWYAVAVASLANLSVDKSLTKMGCKVYTETKEVTEDLENRIMSMHNKKCTVREICEETGLNDNQVRCTLNRNGVVRYKARRTSAEVDKLCEEIKQGYENGKRLNELCKARDIQIQYYYHWKDKQCKF